jgi:hypothetical protein
VPVQAVQLTTSVYLVDRLDKLCDSPLVDILTEADSQSGIAEAEAAL